MDETTKPRNTNAVSRKKRLNGDRFLRDNGSVTIPYFCAKDNG
jgi:hypothetical protein